MTTPSPATPLIDRAAAYFRDLQDRIVAGLERVDGTPFHEDRWDRPGGGGGRTRVLADGGVFEKAGVNFSDVSGELRPDMAAALPGSGTRFRATGISLVLHPRNPHVPTVHANFRRLERGVGEGATGWFGGGADLTPYYLRPEDAVHFHRTLKAACDRHEPAEARVPPTATERDPEALFAFVRSTGDAFLEAYLPIVERRRHEPVTPDERRWQLIRRGRYVEFNLIYDRGTVFGLKTDGRVESILMSLPTEARWEYGHQPAPGSREAETLAAIRSPRDWAGGAG